ncbi:MAG: sulfite exporter TauE/SafE family protein [Deltaproteobacteria bacterium]|nr:sulfite exporter TauE/SafE family protein [Deltaproteobacteria bacterium]
MTPPLDAVSLLGGLGLGALGSAHCVAMCGGIAGALALAPGATGAAAAVARQTAYNVGRITSYAVAGALAGALGVALAGLFGGTGIALLRALAALLLLALGLYLSGWWSGLVRLERLGARLWRRIAPLAARLRPGRSIGGALALGMLWGWLPCGLVYSALALAATAGDWRHGALLMAGFGLGTLPAMLATGLVAGRVGGLARRAAPRRVAGILLIGFGLWTFAASGAVAHLRGAAPAPCHDHGAP